jgi:hypothetical protein
LIFIFKNLQHKKKKNEKVTTKKKVLEGGGRQQKIIYRKFRKNKNIFLYFQISDEKCMKRANSGPWL